MTMGFGCRECGSDAGFMRPVPLCLRALRWIRQLYDCPHETASRLPAVHTADARYGSHWHLDRPDSWTKRHDERCRFQILAKRHDARGEAVWRLPEHSDQ